MNSLVLKYRRVLGGGLHLAPIVVASYSAFPLRFDGSVPSNYMQLRVLVFGAGDAGEMIVRDMRNNAHHDYEPIGLAVDDLRTVGAWIHGVPVLGTRRELSRIVETHRFPATSCSWSCCSHSPFVIRGEDDGCSGTPEGPHYDCTT